ncbi:MAG: hypothetical protein JO209_09990 [Acidisphaera sp.]|nr:hypothetical protein [Acidisphaera sp.]
MPAKDLAANPSVRLAALLAARLTHDISGLLGTTMGALELAHEDPGAGEEALQLAVDAARELGQRLRLLRAAWGPEGGPLGVADLAALAEGLPGRRRVQIDLSALPSTAAFTPAAGRLLLNVLLLGAEALPGGGRVSLAGDAVREVVATIAGPRAAWPAGFAACLADEAAAWQALGGARELQAPLTALLARAGGLGLSFLMAAEAEASPPLLVRLAGPA